MQGKVRLLAKQGGSGLHPNRDKKLLSGSERTVKFPRGLRTLNDTCIGKALVVEFFNRFCKSKLA